MENNAMMNNYYYGQQAMGQPYYGGYDPNMYSYPAMGFNNIPTPANQNALTAEEIQILKNARPASKIDLSIDRNDVLRSMCCHKENGRDVVLQVNDGSGDVYCPICQRRWKPDMKTKEEVQELVSELIDQMENAKWTGDLPTDLTRELFTLIPLLNKYPDIHEYAMNTFNKYYSARGMYNAQDTNIYGMYNSLFGAGTPATGYMGASMQGYYGQPQQPVNGYYGQTPNYGQQQGYVPTNVQTNAMVNPMQAPTYGVNPMAPNQQFVSQANMMMGGSVIPQQPMMNAPVYGTPQQPVVTPAATQEPTGPVITPQADGSVTSEKKIDL
jgi:hypothetical protein